MRLQVKLQNYVYIYIYIYTKIGKLAQDTGAKMCEFLFTYTEAVWEANIAHILFPQHNRADHHSCAPISEILLLLFSFSTQMPSQHRMQIERDRKYSRGKLQYFLLAQGYLNALSLIVHFLLLTIVTARTYITERAYCCGSVC